jgi:hypothetical protein
MDIVVRARLRILAGGQQPSPAQHQRPRHPRAGVRALLHRAAQGHLQRRPRGPGTSCSPTPATSSTTRSGWERRSLSRLGGNADRRRRHRGPDRRRHRMRRSPWWRSTPIPGTRGRARSRPTTSPALASRDTAPDRTRAPPDRARPGPSRSRLRRAAASRATARLSRPPESRSTRRWCAWGLPRRRRPPTRRGSSSSLPDRPTAVFAANDLSAIRVMEVAHELGLSVPDDLSVVGFDNVPEAANACRR